MQQIMMQIRFMTPLIRANPAPIKHPLFHYSKNTQDAGRRRPHRGDRCTAVDAGIDNVARL